MKNLLSSIDFGKLLEKQGVSETLYRPYRIMYDNVLSTKPSVGMFVPANILTGEPIFEPNPIDYIGGGESEKFQADSVDYANALRKVVFKDFEIYASNGIRKESDEEESVEQSIGIKNILHIFWKKGNDSEFVLSHGVNTIEDLLKFNLEVTDNFYNDFYNC